MLTPRPRARCFLLPRLLTLTATSAVFAITDWALDAFRAHYGDAAINKEDIFLVRPYGILHSPEYRRRFAADLKKMLAHSLRRGFPRVLERRPQAGRVASEL